MRDSESLLREGQYIGSFPARHASELASLIRERLPEVDFAFVGDRIVKILVYPALSPRQLSSWRREFQRACRALKAGAPARSRPLVATPRASR